MTVFSLPYEEHLRYITSVEKKERVPLHPLLPIVVVVYDYLLPTICASIQVGHQSHILKLLPFLTKELTKAF